MQHMRMVNFKASSLVTVNKSRKNITTMYHVILMVGSGFGMEKTISVRL